MQKTDHSSLIRRVRTGIKPGAKRMPCPECSGRGWVWIKTYVPCPECGGKGYFPRQK